MAPRIQTRPLPAQSALWSMVGEGDFTDGYATASPLSPQDAMAVGLKMPRWAEVLLHLRNWLVRPFGLKTGGHADSRDAIFPVTYADDDEVIVGIDDSHLNFRVAIRQQDGHIHVGTWVHRNTWFGRAYLAVIMPFHKLILRNTMHQIANASIASAASAP